jgi:hypothetical protein
MKRLILQYEWGNECSCGTENIPFEYSSKEDAFVDFFTLKDKTKEEYLKANTLYGELREKRPRMTDEEYIQKHREISMLPQDPDFQFIGRDWFCLENLEESVTFYELDEWFENYKTK